PGRTPAPEEAPLGEGRAAETAASEPLSPLAHLRALSSRGAEAVAHVGARGQRGKEAPSSATARVQEAGDVLVPWGTSRGPEGLLRGARCRPPSPHLCRLLCGRRPLSGSGQVGGPSFPTAPPAPGWAPAAELLKPGERSIKVMGTEGLIRDPPAKLQEEPVDPQPPPHQKGGSHLVAGRIQRQQGEGKGTSRTSGAQWADGLQPLWMPHLSSAPRLHGSESSMIHFSIHRRLSGMWSPALME
ncbi:hypothetical protein EI555_015933, partial [Monodon monoceros]